MYQYNAIDQKIVDERVAQYRDQVERRLAGELTEDQFRPLRLMNGLYLQRHAYMLRVAIPYGLLSSEQTRMLAHIARKYDKGFGHITTRQNIQYNWPKLAESPDILADLAKVQMHAIQTSGNCIRNISADHLAGVAGDEIEDPRPYCEILRQWSTFHPEFSYLPRKFKIAITGAIQDRAAVIVHDIGFRLVKNDEGVVGFQVIVGGGLGRTPILGATIREFLPKEHLLSYTEAILRVYNLHGNRENKYKARIKILVKSLGPDEFRRQVEEEWEHIKDSVLHLTEEEIARVSAFFVPPEYDAQAANHQEFLGKIDSNPQFARWFEQNVTEHKVPGYNIVAVSLKSPERPPGDITDEQLDVIADLADKYSFGRLRTTHEQNLILSDVPNEHLFALWSELHAQEMATPNIGKVTDIICCPGLDFCDLANAGSIGVSQAITDAFKDDLELQYDIGELKIKMSGCINSCGHHHVGHIGILGINKNDEEYYQIMLGGSAENDASLGKWLGPAISKDEIVGAIQKIVDYYRVEREDGERFLDFYRRVGRGPIKEVVYG